MKHKLHRDEKSANKIADGGAVQLIVGRYDGLSASHRRIADVILASPHDAALMTQEQISAAASVSKATTNRFGRQLGLENYPALQDMLRTDLKVALAPLDDLVAALEPHNLARSAPLTQSMREDLERIARVKPVDGDATFARSCRMLADARSIHWLGLGSSAFIAHYGAFCMGGVRGGSEALSDSSGLEGVDRKMLDATPDDVAVAIGFARYSAISIEVVGQLQSIGVPLIAITDDPSSPFARASTECVIVEPKTGFVLTGSGAGAVSVVEALVRGTATLIGKEDVGRRAARLTSLLGSAVVAPDG